MIWKEKLISSALSWKRCKNEQLATYAIFFTVKICFPLIYMLKWRIARILVYSIDRDSAPNNNVSGHHSDFEQQYID